MFQIFIVRDNLQKIIGPILNKNFDSKKCLSFEQNITVVFRVSTAYKYTV